MPNLPFPVLKRKPSYPYGEEVEDATIRSNMESGYEQTRPRFTRQRSTFTVKFTYLDAEDADKVMLFYRQMNGGGDSFLWTDVSTGVPVEVRFVGAPKKNMISKGLFSIDLVFRET